MGPSPGEPWPPRMHVGTHLRVHCCTALPFLPSMSDPRRGAVLLSEDARPCGTVSKYCSSSAASPAGGALEILKSPPSAADGSGSACGGRRGRQEGSGVREAADSVRCLQ